MQLSHRNHIICFPHNPYLFAILLLLADDQSLPQHCATVVPHWCPHCPTFMCYFICLMIITSPAAVNPQAQLTIGVALQCPSLSLCHCLALLSWCTPSLSAGRADYFCSCFAHFFGAQFDLLICSCTTFFCISSPATLLTDPDFLSPLPCSFLFPRLPWPRALGLTVTERLCHAQMPRHSCQPQQPGDSCPWSA